MNVDRWSRSSVSSLVEHTGAPRKETEAIVHDVLNVFMCTGFSRDTGQYFMKASPVRPGDYIEFFAETDLPTSTRSPLCASDSTRCPSPLSKRQRV